MKLSKTIMLTVMMLLLTSFSVFAEEKAETKKAPVELKNQTHCPVMGGKIDSSSYTDIQGQRVYHCCPGCTASLEKNPDKYFKKAAEEGILFENIQTNCAVSGMKLENKSLFTDFEGRRIMFCSNECATTFEKDPQKYLSKMGAPVEKKKMETGHEGHNH